MPSLLTKIKEAGSNFGKLAFHPPSARRLHNTEKNVATRPLLTATQTDDHVHLVAAGAWTAPYAAQLEHAIEVQVGADIRALDATLDMAGVEQFDTYGAWLLRRLQTAFRDRGKHMRIVALAERYRGLQQDVDQLALAETTAGLRAWLPVDALEFLGRWVSEVWRQLVLFVDMVGALALALLSVLRRPQSFRWTSAIHQLDRVGWRAVPIILLITFLIGGIIAQQGFFHFRKFGADEYVVDMVGILVLREIGVLIVAIMVAGRSGSSYTAELGSMKMREEIDALRTMGFDPVHILILPRVAALIVALPLLTFVGSMAALYGGGLVAWLYGGMSPEIFIARLKEAISLTHFKVGMIKAPFMALAIGVVAVVEGLRVKGSAESLGMQTTTAVVKSIFLVIVLDGLFAVFFASIGM
jgi:phospholipid/cholesterol/gamma-HCH transport system permease protein